MSYASGPQVNAKADAVLHPLDVVRMLRSHVSWWVVPAAICGVLAAGYSLVASRQWQATQGLIVRPAAASVSDERQGKFSDLSEMKTLQETILELAKSQSVVQKALREVGAPSKYRNPEQWPTALDVEDFRDVVDMRPPGGAEFGKTEVFYLSVKDSDRERAKALVSALCKQLEQRMEEIRDQRAQGMIAELERTVAMANGDLTVQNKQLAGFEAKIGADLAELRNLNSQSGSQSEVSQQFQAIEAERRANDARLQENTRLLKLLSAAKDDTKQILATPNTLLVSQPAVSQLKNALVNAQVQTATLLGSRAEKHPFVAAARETEELVRGQLHDEVAVAIRGLEVDVELAAEREQALAAKLTAAKERLSRLAESRAEYATLVASVENHTKLVESARKNLADARANQAGARSASVISRIDGVDAGVRPVGPGRTTITAAGGIGGLLLGFGFVFLFASPVVGGGPKNGPTKVAPNGAVGLVSVPVQDLGRTPEEAFGMFKGMSLEEAIRSVSKAR